MSPYDKARDEMLRQFGLYGLTDWANALKPEIIIAMTKAVQELVNRELKHVHTKAEKKPR
jgi:hypothetical protein